MAKIKKPAPKIHNKGSAQETLEVAVKINADSLMNTPEYYVNHIEVAYSAFDFTLIAAKATAMLSTEQTEQAVKTGKLLLEPSVQIILPVNVMPGLIKALQTQMDKYEENYTKISSLQ